MFKKPNDLLTRVEIGEAYDKLMEHLGVVEDERNTLLKEKGLVYEAIVGDEGINRFTHDEIIERIYDLYDTYVKYVEEKV